MDLPTKEAKNGAASGERFDGVVEVVEGDAESEMTDGDGLGGGLVAAGSLICWGSLS